MRKFNLLAGIAVAVFGLFISQTYAASGSALTACDPAAAAACDPAALAVKPVPVPDEDCNSSRLSATCSASPTCDPSAAAACGFCAACGNPGCDGLCDSFLSHAERRRCGGLLLGGSLFDGVCWSGYINAGYDTNFAGDRSNGLVDAWNNTTPALNAIYVSAEKKRLLAAMALTSAIELTLCSAKTLEFSVPLAVWMKTGLPGTCTTLITANMTGRPTALPCRICT